MGKGAGDVLGAVGKVAGIASPVAGIGFGIANMISGAKQSNDAKRALENYERQQLNNIAEGLQVSTLGADLQREEQARLASSQVQSAREGGARTMIGSLGKIQQGNQMVNRQIGADLDAQQKAIDQMRAEDEARIRAIQENREIADINALSSQINAGEQTRVNGISQGIQGLSTLGNSIGYWKPTPQVDSVDNQLTPQQVVPLSTQANRIQAPNQMPIPYYGGMNRTN